MQILSPITCIVFLLTILSVNAEIDPPIVVEHNIFTIGQSTFTILIKNHILGKYYYWSHSSNSLKQFDIKLHSKWAIRLKLDNEGTHSDISPLINIDCNMSQFGTFDANNRFKATCTMPPLLPKKAASFTVVYNYNPEDPSYCYSTSVPIKMVHASPVHFDFAYEQERSTGNDVINIEGIDHKAKRVVNLEVQYYKVIGPPTNIGLQEWITVAKTQHDFAAKNSVKLEVGGLGMGYIWRIKITSRVWFTNDKLFFVSDPRLVTGNSVTLLKETIPPRVEGGRFVSGSVRIVYQYPWGERVESETYSADEIEIVEKATSSAGMRTFFEKIYSELLEV